MKLSILIYAVGVYFLIQAYLLNDKVAGLLGLDLIVFNFIMDRRAKKLTG